MKNLNWAKFKVYFISKSEKEADKRIAELKSSGYNEVDKRKISDEEFHVGVFPKREIIFDSTKVRKELIENGYGDPLASRVFF